MSHEPREDSPLSTQVEPENLVSPGGFPNEIPAQQRRKWFAPLVVVVSLFLILGLIGAFFFYTARNGSSPPFLSPPPDQASFRSLATFELSAGQAFFQEWKEHIFHKKTVYKIETDENGENFLHATSHGASSVLFKQMNIKPSEHPFLTWEWKAIRFPSNKQNKTLAAKSDNDFVARVYVAFRGQNLLSPLSSDVIQYVWDGHFPEGTHAASPFSKRTKIFVIRSSSEVLGAWMVEKRDLVKDYEMLFGKPLRGSIIAVGIMSDSDNTGTDSEAYYRRLAIGKPEI
ncbi:MAG: DUF3047 domain-containing protein [Candidatus Omnitrophica bacterium]|nr:DUF3047 domain-containing protein [Candidatus Omnitrophota bacterium]